MWNLLKYSGNIAVLDESGYSMTYRAMHEAGKALVNALTTSSNGDAHCLVFSLCDNVLGSIVGYISFLNGRVVPIMLSKDLDEDLLLRLYEEYKPAFIWAPVDECKRLLFKDLEKVYVKYDYALLKTSFSSTTQLYPELGLLLTTSGSTGSPKFVRQSYANILDNAQSIIKYLELNEKERPITTLPMNYTYGLSIINSHLLVGATILLTNKTLIQREFWNFFREAGATSFGGVPYTYEILDHLRFYRMELPSLRTMTQAGGKILPELHEKFAKYAQEKGKKFVVMYGQCEATARMGYLPANKSIEKNGSMGIAIPGGEFYLIDANGDKISKSFTTGELVYMGRNVTLGYAECGEDLIKGDERNGILETGDMAQFDDDGFYYIVGRKKRFLKIFGNRVNLDELDLMIKSRYNIEVACAGIDDHVYIFIIDASISEKIRDFVVNKTKLNPLAFKVLVIDEIPKNDSGKILYRELTRYYE